MCSCSPTSSATMSNPGTSFAPSAASPPARPPAAPAPSISETSTPNSSLYVCTRACSREVRNSICAGVAPFCAPKSFAASVNFARTSHATRNSTPRKRAADLMARIAPRPPSTVAEPPTHTMMRFAPSFRAVSINSPVPIVDAAMTSLFSFPPTKLRPEARAISITARSRERRHCASTGWPRGLVTRFVRFGPPRTSSVPSPPSAIGNSMHSCPFSQQA